MSIRHVSRARSLETAWFFLRFCVRFLANSIWHAASFSTHWRPHPEAVFPGAEEHPGSDVFLQLELPSTGKPPGPPTRLAIAERYPPPLHIKIDLLHRGNAGKLLVRVVVRTVAAQVVDLAWSGG